MKLNRDNARAFNSSLKQAVKELTGQKVRVEIINSYNFPHCWVRIWPETEFSNDFRLKVFDACKFDRANLKGDMDDIYYGNIRNNYISAHVPEWENLFNSLPTKQPDYLFIGTFPCCYSYCDRTKETNGDYHSIGRIFYSPLELKILDNSPKYAAAHEIMQKEFEHLQTVNSIQVSATGQTAKITH